MQLELADGIIEFSESGGGLYSAQIFFDMLNDKEVRDFFKQITVSDLLNALTNGQINPALIQALKKVVQLRKKGYTAESYEKIKYALMFETDIITLYIKKLYGIETNAEDIIAYAINLAYFNNQEPPARYAINRSRLRRYEMLAEVFAKELDGAFSRMEKDIKAKNITDLTTVKLSKYFNPETILNKLNRTSDYRLNEMFQLAETSSPLEELSMLYTFKVGGPGGLKAEQTPADIGILPKESYGIVAAYDTPENANTSRTNRLTLGVFVKNFLGEVENINKNIFETSYSILSPIEAMIPFIEHNDGNRVLLATNQLRSVVPVKNLEPPIIQTGAESILHDLASGIFVVKAEDSGVIEKVTDTHIIVNYDNGKRVLINIGIKPIRTGRGFYGVRLTPVVKTGQKIEKDQVLAESEYTVGKKLNLGVNVLVAFMHYNGYTFEDGIVVSETFAKKLGVTRKIEIITIPIWPGEKIEFLNLDKKYFGQGKTILRVSSVETVDEHEVVKDTEQSISVEYHGKGRSYKAEKGGLLLDVQIYSNIKDLKSICANDEVYKLLKQYKDEFDKKYSVYLQDYADADIVNEPLYLIKPVGGTYKHEDKVPSVIIRLILNKYTEADLGDKLCNRHGNKGVITKILPDELMPKTEYGETVHVILDPLGVINRMNIGQVFEAALAYILKHLYLRNFKDKPADLQKFKNFVINLYKTMYENHPAYEKIIAWLSSRPDSEWLNHLQECQKVEAITVIIPPFLSPISANKNLIKKLEEMHNIKTEQQLYLPEFGQKTVYRVQIGYMYMFKLEHTTDSVLHARFLGPRHSLTKQAVKGRKKGGGFTFGEFDSYQMLAHDVPAVLAELGYLNAESDEFIHVLRQKAIGAEPTLPDTVNIYSTRNLDLILTALYIKRTM